VSRSLNRMGLVRQIVILPSSIVDRLGAVLTVFLTENTLMIFWIQQ
jgi:hypothetical protein